jgi:hypothetical protein
LKPLQHHFLTNKLEEAPMSDQDAPQQRPLEGWTILADVVSDTAPGIAEFMVLLANLARVTAEGQLDGLFEMAISRLDMSGHMYAALRNSLAESAFPLSAEVLVDALVAVCEQLSDEERALIANSPNGLADVVTAQCLKSPRMGDYDEIADLHRHLADEVARLHKEADVILQASCSIEPPELLGEVPIDCTRLAHTWWPNDLLGVAELSYGQSLRKTFTGRVHSPGPVGGGPAGGFSVKIDKKHKDGYDPGINEQRVQSFYRNWTLPGVNSWVYTLHVTEGYLQIANNVAAKLLEKHRNEITKAAREKAKSAAEDIAKKVTPKIGTALGVTAATASAVLHPLVPLAAAAAAAVIGIIVDKIISAFKGKNLTTWSIGHTVVTDSKMVPLSIFTLSHDKEPNLCELATGKKGKQKLACDYADSDVFDRARFMLGTTTLNEMTAVKFDHAYFELVAKENKPLAWHNPYKTRGGFRVLLPHSRSGSDAMYVSAVRADVRYGYVGSGPADDGT